MKSKNIRKHNSATTSIERYSFLKELRDRGYSPIPLFPPDVGGPRRAGKAPADFDAATGWRSSPGWDRYRAAPATDAEIEQWSAWTQSNLGIVLGTAAGGFMLVGLDADTATDDDGTIPADRDAAMVQALHHLLARVGAAGAPIRRGAKGGLALVMVQSVPDDAGRKTVYAHNELGKIELMTGGQCAVPPSIHPRTGTPYAWTQGADDGDLPPDVADLPVVDWSAVVDALEAGGFTAVRTIAAEVAGGDDLAAEIETGPVRPDLLDDLEADDGPLGTLWRDGTTATGHPIPDGGSGRRFALAGRMRGAGFNAAEFAEAVQVWPHAIGDGGEPNWPREVARCWSRCTPINDLEATTAFAYAVEEPANDNDDGGDIGTTEDAVAALAASDAVAHWRRLLALGVKYRQRVQQAEEAVTEIAFAGTAADRRKAAKALTEARHALARIDRAIPTAEAAAEVAAPGVVLGLESLDGPEPEAEDWLVEGVATTVGVSISAGRSGAGKSTAAQHMIGCVVAGVPFFGNAIATRGAGLYLLAATEGAVETRPKMRALRDHVLADRIAADAFHISWRVVSSPAEIEPAIVRAKAHFAARGVPLALVVIDSLAAVMQVRDENDNSQARDAMTTLAAIALRHGLHINVVAHHGKDADRAVRGASAFGDLVSNILTFTKAKDGDLRTVRMSKTRLNASGSDDVLGFFKLRSVEVGRMPSGRPILAGIVEEVGREPDTDGDPILVALAAVMRRTGRGSASRDDVKTELDRQRIAKGEAAMLADTFRRQVNRLLTRGRLVKAGPDGLTFPDRSTGAFAAASEDDE